MNNSLKKHLLSAGMLGGLLAFIGIAGIPTEASAESVPVTAGQVLNEVGWPVAGLPVVATARGLFGEQPSSDFDESPLEQSTVTDGSGYFVFEYLPDGEYKIHTLAMDDYLPTSRTVRAGVDDASLVVVEQREIWVDGAVTSTEGYALGGVEVFVPGAREAVAVSDASGNFEFPFTVRGNHGHLITLQARGYEPQKLGLSRRDWQGGGQVGIDVVMEPKPMQLHAMVSGVVVNEYGEPVAGEQVYLKRHQTKYKTTTDAMGQFLFDDVESGDDYRLWLMPKGPYKQYWEKEIEIRPGGMSGLEIVLESVGVGRISGQMLDTNGYPVPNFTLSVRNENVRSTPLSVTSDGAGYFAIDGVPDGRVRLESKSFPRFVISGIELSAGSETEVDLFLDRGNQQVRGWVVDDLGQPVPLADIILSWVYRENGRLHESLRKTTTSADGSFLFTQLGGVARTLTVGVPGYEAVTIEEVGGVEFDELEIHLAPLPSE